ncbi:Alpha-soluble NSF attachment protein 2 [Capsicum chinense]|nr:Alpha-soluble NSF attachment protein 2 [Capsicum chinense]
MGFYGSDLWALGSYWATFQNLKGPSRKGKKEVLFHKAANCFKNAKSVINMLTMGDEISRGKELVKKAEKKLNGSNYYEAADVLSKAANWFELAESWDRVGAVYVKLSSCHMKLDCKDEAACAHVTAADCYKKIKNSRGGSVLISCAFCPNLVCCRQGWSQPLAFTVGVEPPSARFTQLKS